VRVTTTEPDPLAENLAEKLAENLAEKLAEKLTALPPSPGVYLFKDKAGVVVYVGKAKSLRSRVRSYFQSSGSDTRYFLPMLQRSIADLDTIVTQTEKEAAILEHTLVKQHMPRFNVKLRDDKSFLLLRLGVDHEWPRVEVVRRPEPQDGGPASSKKAPKYFGPYHSATAARRTLHLINKHFQLRTCTDVELRSRRRPCLQYQIKRCPAPCVFPVDAQWYASQVRAVQMFIEGRHDELSAELVQKMHDAARETKFELAAVYRDQLRAIDLVREEQRVVSIDAADRDVLGLYREGDLVEIALLHVRAGKLADVATSSLKNTEIPDEEVIAGFLAQQWGGEVAPSLAPDEILLPIAPDVEVGIEEWISDRAGRKVRLLVPQRGPRVDLIALANENARHAFLEKRRTGDDVLERLAQLQEKLRLPTTPRRIECCDISHLGGGDTVGAVVAMTDGQPDKRRYRTFHVRTLHHELKAGDDYSAMYEVLARRFRRGRKAAENAAPSSELSPSELAPESLLPGASTPMPASDTNEPVWDLPDLFVVDGGRGQLGVALTAAHDLGLHDLPIVAIAKEKENALGEELVDRVYLPGQKNPVPLRSTSAALFFLARLRDEAHRFSNRARERVGKARRLRSALDDVPGIGPVLKKSLLRTLGSVAAIQRATDDELLAVPGIKKRHIEALRRSLPPPSA
jgi:excinuclease ABC subunit C